MKQDSVGAAKMGGTKLRAYVLGAFVFSALTAVGWVVLLLEYANSPDGLKHTVWAGLIGTLGYLIFVPIFFTFLDVSHTNQIRTALKRGEVSRLRELDTLTWGILSLVLCNPVTGVLLIVARPPINRLRGTEGTGLPSDDVLSVQHLVKLFPVKRTLSQVLRGAGDMKVHAVDDVSFEVKRRQVFGLAGESGSGKTTVLRTALMLTPPTSGSIFFMGKDVSKLTRKELKQVRTKLQVVFQDPYDSINPRMPVFDVVAEGLYVNKLVSTREEAQIRVERALRDVQLTPPKEFLDRYPHELSGGQRQRVAIARALVLEPDLILADEPVSMLDVSVRAEVINVLLAIREGRGISVMMVTHDLALSKDVVDKLAVMYLGKIVESGPAQEVVSAPYHPYTQALVAAVPVPDPTAPRIQVLAKGEIPTNVSPPSGCRFHPRCAFAKDICASTEPPLAEVAPGREVACHFWKEAHEAFSRRGGNVGA